jgi:hypothetical protein
VRKKKALYYRLSIAAAAEKLPPPRMHIRSFPYPPQQLLLLLLIKLVMLILHLLVIIPSTSTPAYTLLTPTYNQKP